MTAETPKPSSPISTSIDPHTGRTISAMKDPAYWQALGQFIEAFASTETVLFTYMTLCAQVRPDSARALLSGIHVDPMIDLVKRVWKGIPPDADILEKLSGALEQFKMISDRRKSMVHYVSFVTGDKGRASSNITRASTNRRLREHRISPEIVQDMTTDVAKIGDHLSYAVCALAVPHLNRNELMNSFPAITASWRYRQPEDQ